MGSTVGAAETAQLSHETVVTVAAAQQVFLAALRAQRRSFAQANVPRTRFAALDTTPSLQQQSPHPQSAATTAAEVVVTVVTVVVVAQVEVAQVEVAHAEVAHAEVAQPVLQPALTTAFALCTTPLVAQAAPQTTRPAVVRTFDTTLPATPQLSPQQFCAKASAANNPTTAKAIQITKFFIQSS